MEWEIWLVDGTTRDSSRHSWEEVPDGVLVVRVWGGPKGSMILWGDAYYGRPDTLKMEGRVADEEFTAVLARAQAQPIPPSLRGVSS